MDTEIGRGERTRRLVWRLATVAAVLLCIAAGSGSALEWLRPKIDETNARIAVVERGRVEATLRATGTVVPTSERIVASPVPGRIVEVLEDPGALLETGQAIVRLDASTTRLDLARLRDRLDVKRAERREVRLRYEGALETLADEAALKLLDLETAKYRLEQQSELSEAGLVSDSQLREAEVSVERARISVRRVESDRESAENDHVAAIEKIDAEIRTLTAEIADAERRLSRADFEAESPGVLTWVFEEIGAAIAEGEPVARIADLGAYEIEASVSDGYATRLAVGQLARVECAGAEMTGRVEAIRPEIESGAVHFVVGLDESDHDALRPSMRATVLIVTDVEESALRVRRGPFIARGGAAHEVFVVEGDRAVKREVRLGLLGHRFVEAAAGLEEGDVVAISDTTRFQNAKSVKVRGDLASGREG